MTVKDLIEKKKETGMTIARISEISHIPVSTLAKIFSGETKNPRIQTIYAVSDALNQSGFDFEAYKVKLAKEKETIGEHSFILEEAERYIVHQYTIDDWFNLPDGVRKELIDGVFYDMAEPSIGHQRTVFSMGVQVANQIKKLGGGCEPFISPVGVRLDCDDYTMVEPDFLIVCDPSKVKDRYIDGAPDFVVEVLSDSTRRHDMGRKAVKYEHAGVREYWMIDLKNEKILKYFYENPDYLPEIEPLRGVHEIKIYDGRIKVEF